MGNSIPFVGRWHNLQEHDVSSLLCGTLKGGEAGRLFLLAGGAETTIMAVSTQPAKLKSSII